MHYSIVTTERSLILTAGSCQIHITGSDWSEINSIAHIIGALLVSGKNMNDLRSRLERINSVVNVLGKELVNVESMLTYCK